MDSYEFDETQKKFIEQSVIPYAVYLFVDRRVVTLAVSNGLCELMGLSRSQTIDLLNNDMYRNTHPDDVARVADLGYQFAVGGELYDAVYRTKSKSGKYVIVHAHGRKVRAKDGTPLAFTWYMVEPLNARKKIEAERQLGAVLGNVMRDENMFHHNLFDGLTGLPNMTHFFSIAQDAGEKARAAGKVPQMLFFDLSGMKGFNGRYGYAEGDKLIREVSVVLKNHFTSDFCGRLGQDHFVAYTEDEDVEKILEDIFKETEQVNGGRSLPLRVGIYEDKYDVVDASMAYDRAKMACDKDRSAHISKYTHYDMALRKETLTRDYVLSNLEKALSEKWIRAFYQPIMRVSTGNVSDEEALCRWIDPERGIISPLDFIPVLEDAKLIHKLDLYMVDRVIEDLELKKSEGIRPIPVSINLSRYDFRSCDMVKEIVKKVDKARIDRNLINIEITESFASSDADFLKIQIARFHEAGFKVWMDDFGSGYSSLNALADFDFDLIKFDMVFLKKFDVSERARIILGEMLGIAKKLGIDTVVEGVETEEQVRFLSTSGCDKCQGFYFDKPASVRSIIEKIKTGMCFNAELVDGSIETVPNAKNYILSSKPGDGSK